MELTTSFKILGIDPDSNEAQAKHAYKAQVRRWHPDQFPEGSLSKTGAEEQLKQINVAYARVKAHLAMVRPDPVVHAPPSYSPRDASRQGDAPGQKPEKRSWVDHLFNTLNAFTGHGEGTPGQARADATARRRKTFRQVLDELGGGSPSAKPKRQSGRHPVAPRRTTAGNRSGRRRTTTVGAAGGTESPGPVKPVSRVRGIGRSR